MLVTQQVIESKVANKQPQLGLQLTHTFRQVMRRDMYALCDVNVTLVLQEAAVAAVSGDDVAETPSGSGMLRDGQASGSSSSLTGSQNEESEVARFGAAKEKKHSLENGITVFNR